MSTMTRREIEQFRKAGKGIDAERLKEAIEQAGRAGVVCFEENPEPDGRSRPLTDQNPERKTSRPSVSFHTRLKLDHPKSVNRPRKSWTGNRATA